MVLKMKMKVVMMIMILMRPARIQNSMKTLKKVQKKIRQMFRQTAQYALVNLKNKELVNLKIAGISSVLIASRSGQRLAFLEL